MPPLLLLLLQGGARVPPHLPAAASSAGRCSLSCWRPLSCWKKSLKSVGPVAAASLQRRGRNQQRHGRVLVAVHPGCWQRQCTEAPDSQRASCSHTHLPLPAACRAPAGPASAPARPWHCRLLASCASTCICARRRGNSSSSAWLALGRAGAGPCAAGQASCQPAARNKTAQHPAAPADRRLCPCACRYRPCASQTASPVGTAR